MNTQHIQLNVPLSFNQVVEIVKQLSPKEKKQLSDVLQSTPSTEAIEIPDTYKQFAKQRLNRLEENPETGLTWQDIESKIKL